MATKKRRKKLQYIRNKFPKIMQKKLVIVFVTIILAFVFLVGRITYINASSGEKYTKVVLDQQKFDSRVIPFKRGDIIDRNGTKVATSERVYNVIFDAKVLLSSTKKKESIKQTKAVLEECFGIAEGVVDGIIDENPSSRYNILLKGVSYDVAKQFEAMEEDNETYPYLSGVWLEDDYIRKYPYATMASDLIGFTVAGNVGNNGIELSYNSVLNGTNGREYGYLDETSSLERTVKEPTNGKTVVSTIDVNLQKIVEEEIIAFNEAHKNEAREGEGSKNTAVVIMKPNTGEILAMSDYPNYDLNNPRDLTRYYTEEAIAAMTEEEKLTAMQQLWNNFCVSETFEPGSTMKPFTVAAGLESGKLNGNEHYSCGGTYTVGEPIDCHYKPGHGNQSIGESIANSCNVSLMKMSEVIGVEEFSKYQRIFGFGEFTGIDLRGEPATAGLLYNAEDMKPIDLAVNSFGQGFNLTMLQMTAGFSSLINGGNLYQPYVVKQIQDQQGNVLENKEPVLVKKTISEETGNMLKEYMRLVLTQGTGKAAQVEGYDIGGKTGTAEKIPRGNGKHILSFIGYAPQENPEIVVYVVIDEPNVDKQAVSSYVTELSQKIMARAFPYLNITKAPAGE